MLPRHSSNDGSDDSHQTPKKCKWCEDKIYITLTDEETDDLLNEYQIRPKMWDPAVPSFQDHAYLLSAKREIARKFNMENGMHSVYINATCVQTYLFSILADSYALHGFKTSNVLLIKSERYTAPLLCSECG